MQDEFKLMEQTLVRMKLFQERLSAMSDDMSRLKERMEELEGKAGEIARRCAAWKKMKQ